MILFYLIRTQIIQTILEHKIKFLKYHPMNLILEMDDMKDVIVLDCGTSHTILKDKRYFLNLTLKNANVHTIAGTHSLIEGHG